MPKIADTDQAEIFGDPDLADLVTIAGKSVYGYFFAPYENALEIAGNKPTFRCARSDVLTIIVGDSLVYSGTNYRISSRQEERAGSVVFELKAPV